MLKIHVVSAFADNYIWLIEAKDTAEVIIVDPGDATPVISALQKKQLQPVAILITHSHHDHTGGIAALTELFDLAVYGPTDEPVSGVIKTLAATAAISLHPSFPPFQILNTPGHTSGHISFLTEQKLFCGDTLFAGGCGRLLGGSAEQLHHSLQQLAMLNPATEIYCAHEYTKDNLRFAKAVEADNQVLQQRIKLTDKLRADHRPTVPSLLSTELATNPFLRCSQATVKNAAEQHSGHPLTNPQAVFSALRKWKDAF